MKLDKKIIKELEKDLENCETIDDLLGKDGLVKKLIKNAVEKMLDGELTHHLGYKKYERKKNGNSRNGTSQKTLQCDHGEIGIDIPRDRNGEFDPILVKKHQKRLGQLEDKIISMYAKGMTTRDIQSHITELYGIEISATGISTITDKVLTLLEDWQSRVLDELYVIIYLDAIFYKVREDGKVSNKAAYTCLGINKEGEKEILGLWVHETESAQFWLSVLTDLKNRGVQDVLIACIDGLKGFPEAIATIYPKTEVQLCIIHQIRNSLRYIGWKHQRLFMKDLKLVYKASTKSKAEAELKNLEKKWGDKYPIVIKSWKTKWDQLSVFFKYPAPIRKIIYTTNILEGVHRQLRKVTKNRSVFVHDDALKKLLFLALTDVSKKWNKVHGWISIISQLAIFFEDRLKLDV